LAGRDSASSPSFNCFRLDSRSAGPVAQAFDKLAELSADLRFSLFLLPLFVPLRGDCRLERLSLGSVLRHVAETLELGGQGIQRFPSAEIAGFRGRLLGARREDLFDKRLITRAAQGLHGLDLEPTAWIAGVLGNQV
jgi:hypothetical protein